MSSLLVENRVSLHAPADGTQARWTIKGDVGKITLYLPTLWGIVVENLGDWESTPLLRDFTISVFEENLDLTYLVERICIERAHERIRLKGGRCRPAFRKPHESLCRIGRLAKIMMQVPEFYEIPASH